MSRPKQYEDRNVVTTNIEKGEHELAFIWDISLAEALQTGIYFVIKTKIDNRDSIATAENIEKYAQALVRYCGDQKVSARMRDALQTKISTVPKPPEKMLRAWDGDLNKFVILPASQVDPRYYDDITEVK